MKISILFFVFLIALNTYAQYKHDYVWIVGNPTEDTIYGNGLSVFNFNNQKLEISKQFDGLSLFLTNSSISNNDGQLLFYSNGCSINDANSEQMQGGFNLNPGFAYDSGNCPDFGDAIPNGLIILPLPEDSIKYYIFHQSSEFAPQIGTHVGKLYYTVVDMSQNNGLGKVIDKNHIVLDDTLLTGMHAVRHTNGEDWWVMAPERNTNQFYKIHFTANGISEILEQSIGLVPDWQSSGGGQMRFSPDGTKFARYHSKNQVELFDFDRSTGELSNFQHLIADTVTFSRGGLAFSSNSRFLYISTQSKLFQFDLLATDIQASKVFIDEWDGFTVNGFSVMFYLMQLAPDCKIYMIPVNGSKYMHVIEHPNEPGLACDFRQRGLVLPAINNTSIPNFPNYRLGTGYPVCDSSIVYVSSDGYVPPPVQEARVWPNPASEELNLELIAPTAKPVRICLFDATGRLAREWPLVGIGQPQSLNLHGLANGLYFWQTNTVEGQQLGRGKLVIVK